jgi:hypothetical protein
LTKVPHDCAPEAKLEAVDARALVCGKHKTAKFYGSIAKWIPPGVRMALLVYINLPCKESKKLFEPASVSE